MKKHAVMLLLAVAAAALSLSAHGGLMLQPVGVTTDMGNFPTFEPIYSIDQSGLTAEYVSGVTDFDTFVTSTATVQGGSSRRTWFSAAVSLTGHIDFDLGSVNLIESLAYWADPQGIGQSVNSFRLLADDNAAFSSPTLLGEYIALDGTSNETNFGQIFSFTPTSASHVRIEILSNHGSTVTTGISEVAFEVVPEPSTLALLGLGLLSVRRRSL